jgi:putative ABC transport system substrate-binding protein
MPLDERARHVAGRTPLERPTRFELVVNLKTGNALGVTMPQSILLSAAELFQ